MCVQPFWKGFHWGYTQILFHRVRAHNYHSCGYAQHENRKLCGNITQYPPQHTNSWLTLCVLDNWLFSESTLMFWILFQKQELTNSRMYPTNFEIKAWRQSFFFCKKYSVKSSHKTANKPAVFPQSTHINEPQSNYQRKHAYNVWSYFVVGVREDAVDTADVQTTLNMQYHTQIYKHQNIPRYCIFLY